MTRLSGSIYSPFSDVISHAATLMRYFMKFMISEAPFKVKWKCVCVLISRTYTNTELIFLQHFQTDAIKHSFKTGLESSKLARLYHKGLSKYLWILWTVWTFKEMKNNSRPQNEDLNWKKKIILLLLPLMIYFWHAANEGSTSNQPSNGPKNCAAVEFDRYCKSRVWRDIFVYIVGI